MTENEALKLMESFQISKDCELIKTLDFKATVIKSLEDLQQYRAIGTVEELVNTQIREKVLNVELESYKEIGTIEEIKEKLSLLEKYEELGTVEELDEVLSMIC